MASYDNWKCDNENPEVYPGKEKPYEVSLTVSLTVDLRVEHFDREQAIELAKDLAVEWVGDTLDNERRRKPSEVLGFELDHGPTVNEE